VQTAEITVLWRPVEMTNWSLAPCVEQVWYQDMPWIMIDGIIPHYVLLVPHDKLLEHLEETFYITLITKF
jgi:hypothetical protein